jgi:hypothetical protein
MPGHGEPRLLPCGRSPRCERGEGKGGREEGVGRGGGDGRMDRARDSERGPKKWVKERERESARE